MVNTASSRLRKLCPLLPECRILPNATPMTDQRDGRLDDRGPRYMDRPTTFLVKDRRM